MNNCEKARRELADIKTILYRDVIARLDDLAGEIRSLEMGRSSVNFEDVEDDLTRLLTKFEEMTGKVQAARDAWIAANRIT